MVIALRAGWILSRIPEPDVAFRFAMYPQDEANWCWLAIASSVAHHYSGKLRRQCDLAQALVPHLPYGTTCCVSPTPTACDAQGNPSVSLGHLGHSRGSSTGLAPFVDFVAEISKGRPVAISFVYAQSGVSHVIAVTDAFKRNGVQILRVDDPDGATRSNVRYGSTTWRGLPVSWVRTYFTKP